ncbi:MAG: tyrosine--tRNA ligase [Chitinivibrionales bacterium]|nr:tyrosine--tRNA ligase [Chitinivibrionales bacterium]
MTLLDDLQWRGMVQEHTPGAEKLLEKGPVVLYAGFDPTASSLQLGNLVPIMLLLHFQRRGHKPIALVGGATGMIGDPSGKSAERVLLSPDDVQKNLAGFKKQLEKILDFDCGGSSAEIMNNYDWFKSFGYIDFLRDAGKHLTINYMTAKESVKQRMETGLSYTEFSYQLLQAYDFVWLHKNKNCTFQVGGSDQWGNMTSGTELVRRMLGKEAHALTCPLLTKADGAKFGKTAAGEKIWLDPKMTSPYKFYQFWLNAADDDAAQFIRIFTLLPREEIEHIEKRHAEAPHKRVLQKAVAKDITCRVHSEDDYKAAVDASEVLFGKGTTGALKKLSERDFLSMFDGVPKSTIAKSLLESGTPVIDLLAVHTRIFQSKGEARRMLAGGGVSINKQKIIDIDTKISTGHLLNKRYILVQRGKKNYYVIIAE